MEYLAVRKLAGSGRADVLLLVGPPGVGKTSIGQAIADATGRKLVRVALGGVRDEAELRGHRRTYIGARPGRLVEGLRRAGTADPVILLDEVDKLGSGTWGDPAAALLEILDPEQNDTFVDRYLEVPFDLSKALFVATANDLASIPGPLRDRMQRLEIAGYSQREKLVIAREHLLHHGGQERRPRGQGRVVHRRSARGRDLTAGLGRPGVRELQRVLGKVYRAAGGAQGARPGDRPPATSMRRRPAPSTWASSGSSTRRPRSPSSPASRAGLAWTPVGGSVLYVEANTLPGRGSLVLTGQLGDVMKESARAALTYVLAHAEDLGIPTDRCSTRETCTSTCPPGRCPRMVPRPGVTMFTALASLLSGRAGARRRRDDRRGHLARSGAARWGASRARCWPRTARD